MSRDLNKCCFIGRLGNDPESKELPSGNTVTSISIAVGDDYKDKQGNKVEQTEWVRVSAFGNLADIMAKYLRKGSRVYIEGKMKTRSWEQDGVKRYATEINASEMYMLDTKQDGQQAQEQPKRAPEPEPATAQDSFDDDIPF